MKILALSSSVRGEESRSLKMLRHFIAGLEKKSVAVEVVYRDLAKETPPHYSSALREASVPNLGVPLSEAALAASEVSLKLINEVKEADLLLLAVPIYNWAIPSTLKCWIDQVIRLDHTFKTTEDAIVGLLDQPNPADPSYNARKKAVFFVSSGLTPAVHVTKYLNSIMGFIGIHDCSSVGAAYLDQETVPAEAYARVDEAVAQLVGSL